MNEAAEQEYHPVKVHVVADTSGAPPRPRKTLVTRFGTETVDDDNPVRPLLPESADRECAYVQATGHSVYLCDSESKALQAADTANSHLGTLLPQANTAPWPVRGTQPVWVAQVTAGFTCIVSFTADYEC